MPASGDDQGVSGHPREGTTADLHPPEPGRAATLPPWRAGPEPWARRAGLQIPESGSRPETDEVGIPLLSSHSWIHDGSSGELHGAEVCEG